MCMRWNGANVYSSLVALDLLRTSTPVEIENEKIYCCNAVAFRIPEHYNRLPSFEGDIDANE